MAKRHLKVTGDLGRVIFMVWASLRRVYAALGNINCRSSTYGTPHPLRKVYGIQMLSLIWLGVNLPQSTQGHLEFLFKKLTRHLGTFPMKMYTLRELNGLRRRLPNIILTDSFTSPPSMLIRSRHPNSTGLRLVLAIYGRSAYILIKMTGHR